MNITHRQIIEMWPRVDTFAADVEAREGTTRAWMLRNRIPPEHWKAVVEAAHRRDIPITYKMLAEAIAA